MKKKRTKMSKGASCRPGDQRRVDSPEAWSAAHVRALGDTILECLRRAKLLNARRGVVLAAWEQLWERAHACAELLANVGYQVSSPTFPSTYLESHASLVAWFPVSGDLSRLSEAQGAVSPLAWVSAIRGRRPRIELVVTVPLATPCQSAPSGGAA